MSPARSACVLLMLALTACAGQRIKGPVPLERAHSHNDYQHARPCLDALDNGFCSVEADIYLIDGELRVAHDRDQAKPGRTLQSLYLDPLRQRVLANGGRVFPGGPTVTLLIDFKTDAEPTYAALAKALAAYAPMLTSYGPGRCDAGAVTVIVSGNRPRAMMEAQPLRYASLDGRLEDLSVAVPVQLMPLISANWTQAFKWRGAGPLPEAERQQLRRYVEQAHARGQRIRFWGIPDNPTGWAELYSAGVDLINTDKLVELRDFLLSHEAYRR